MEKFKALKMSVWVFEFYYFLVAQFFGARVMSGNYPRVVYGGGSIWSYTVEGRRGGRIAKLDHFIHKVLNFIFIEWSSLPIQPPIFF